MVCQRPVVCTVATWVRDSSGRRRLRDSVKLRALSRCNTVAISNAVADHLGQNDIPVIYPSFRAGQFPNVPSSPERSPSIVFVGRLVADKGVSDLLSALSLLPEGRSIPVSIIGDGPEAEALKGQTLHLGLENVSFLGAIHEPHRLMSIMAQHSVMAIPSKWNEPFGIVGLEALRAGCVPVISSEGGLSEAVGDFGIPFSNGSIEQLCTSLEAALSVPPPDPAAIALHLEQFTPEREANAYLNIMAALIGRNES